MKEAIKELLKTLLGFAMGIVVFWVVIHKLMKPVVSYFMN
jgi:hypothetical protein